MKALLAAVAIALAGCSGSFPERGPVHIDPRIPEPVQAEIRKGHASWCRATNGVECPELKRGRGRHEWRWGTRDKGNAGVNRGLFGGVTVTLDLSRMPAWSWLAVVNHEIGHALELEHAPRGLMVEGSQLWKRERPSCIDQRTLAELCEERGCEKGVTPECLEP